MAQGDETDETSAEKRMRLSESLRGLMKDEIAQRAGCEAYLRWVRGYDEPQEDAWQRAERCGRL